MQNYEQWFHYEIGIGKLSLQDRYYNESPTVNTEYAIYSSNNKEMNLKSFYFETKEQALTYIAQIFESALIFDGDTVEISQTDKNEFMKQIRIERADRFENAAFLKLNNDYAVHGFVRKILSRAFKMNFFNPKSPILLNRTKVWTIEINLENSDQNFLSRGQIVLEGNTVSVGAWHQVFSDDSFVFKFHDDFACGDYFFFCVTNSTDGCTYLFGFDPTEDENESEFEWSQS